MDDANELLRRCQRGDESALAGLIERVGGRVLALAIHVLGDRGQAEEATADAFARLWSTSRKWRGDADAGTWVYRVAYHAILDHVRRKRPAMVSPPGHLADPRPGPFDAAVRAEAEERAARHVHEAIGQLSEADRALVHLYYFDELRLAEIAVIVGATRDVLKMRLARARHRLRELIGDEEPT